MTSTSEQPAPTQNKASFEALRHGDFRAYFVNSMLWMLGDQTEHVISYWIVFQLFHSPFLAGYAVISHWVPFLLFSVYMGALADRYDCRKIIQISNCLFIGVSLAWGVLLLTGQLQVWHAIVLFTIHGLAGSIGGPAGQLIIHDIVGQRQLQSAVRLNSTAIQLGTLLGPALGGLLMLLLGPAAGLFVNALVYVPRSIWLLRIRYTGHTRETEATPGRRWMGIGDALGVLRSVSSNRTIVAMITLTGSSALLVGTAFLVLMPEYSLQLGSDRTGITYTALLSAHALGAVVGGVALDAAGLLQARTRTAVICMGLWAASMLGFAFIGNYPAALLLLFLAGAFNLTFNSMAQTLVQLLAPANIRGRVVGLYTMSSAGLRFASGISVGLLGGFIGINWSLGLSALALLLVALGILAFTQRDASSTTLAGEREAHA
jgi:MFS family permease